ncbi:MAG: hypothetical protein VW713_08400 [Alphaproteobacteria bacterium]|jgi:hypothetical protein
MADSYIAGTWLGVCQRCGFEKRNTQLRLEWTGLRVCRECFDERHPQDSLRGVSDRQAPPWTSPEPEDVDVGTVTPDDL